MTPSISFNLAIIVVFATSLIAQIICWKRFRTPLVLGAVLTLAGHATILLAMHGEVRQTLHEIDVRIARDGPLNSDDPMFMYDGTGDMCFALLVGWIPGALGFATGFGGSAILRHLAGPRVRLSASRVTRLA